MCCVLSIVWEVYRGWNGEKPMGRQRILQALVAGEALGAVLRRHAKPQGGGEGVPALFIRVEEEVSSSL